MYRIKIKKSVICKVNIVIDLNLPETDVLGSIDPEGKISIQGLVDSINKTFVDSIEEVGFTPLTNIPRYVSQRNGGYALYSSFEFIELAVKFKLLLDIRLADHPTKHLEEKLEDRKNILKQTYSKIEKGQAECYVIDSYIEQHGGNICIYFGAFCLL